MAPTKELSTETIEIIKTHSRRQSTVEFGERWLYLAIVKDCKFDSKCLLKSDWLF